MDADVRDSEAIVTAEDGRPKGQGLPDVKHQRFAVFTERREITPEPCSKVDVKPIHSPVVVKAASLQDLKTPRSCREDGRRIRSKFVKLEGNRNGQRSILLE
jgi:hypothetical protein